VAANGQAHYQLRKFKSKERNKKKIKTFRNVLIKLSEIIKLVVMIFLLFLSSSVPFITQI
jgi:hypothetical protein